MHNAKQQSTRIVCNISNSGSNHCLSSTPGARSRESEPSNPEHRNPFLKFLHIFAFFVPQKYQENKHAKQSTISQNNITVLKDGAFWGLSKVILQTLTLQSQANNIGYLRRPSNMIFFGFFPYREWGLPPKSAKLFLAKKIRKRGGGLCPNSPNFSNLQFRI